MNLHEAIQSYIEELQELIKEPDPQTLLDKAHERWGQNDPRYEVFELLLKSDNRFSQPPKPLGAESQSGQGSDPTNKPVK